LARLTFDTRESDTEDDGIDDDLKDVVPRGSIEQTAGNDVFKKRVKGHFGLSELLACVSGGIELNAGSGLNKVHSGKTDKESEGSDDLKVDDGFEREPANRFEVVCVPGDTDNQSAEKKRDDDALDEMKEERRYDFGFGGIFGAEPAEENAEDHGDANPVRQRYAAHWEKD